MGAVYHASSFTTKFSDDSSLKIILAGDDSSTEIYALAYTPSETFVMFSAAVVAGVNSNVSVVCSINAWYGFIS